MFPKNFKRKTVSIVGQVTGYAAIGVVGVLTKLVIGAAMIYGPLIQEISTLEDSVECSNRIVKKESFVYKDEKRAYSEGYVFLMNSLMPKTAQNLENDFDAAQIYGDSQARRASLESLLEEQISSSQITEKSKYQSTVLFFQDTQINPKEAYAERLATGIVLSGLAAVIAGYIGIGLVISGRKLWADTPTCFSTSTHSDYKNNLHQKN